MANVLLKAGIGGADRVIEGGPTPEDIEAAADREWKHEVVLCTKPHRADVGDVLDGYLLCSNGVFAMTTFSLVLALYHIIFVHWTVIETLQIAVDVLTLVTAVFSVWVAFSGSRAGAALCAFVMLLRFSLHAWICYIAFGFDKYVHHMYPLSSKAMFVLNAVMSFATLVYYFIFYRAIDASSGAELKSGVVVAQQIRANRKIAGKAHSDLVADCLNMDEVALFEDMEGSKGKVKA